ncbi:unnamed protein product [Triticum turgidum subsp. durum]|uniref:t-SNARE coiled-coil homology domain-containing protein n=1 Tax=Triticum turgidum subsp. durum TaxID=4567 RepID=A0A9R0UV93_TRITD|nr:unnamed protein product [Triticum turgidum subsp. durum]
MDAGVKLPRTTSQQHVPLGHATTVSPVNPVAHERDECDHEFMSTYWQWRRRRRAQHKVDHPCVGVVNGEELTTGMQRLRSGLLRGHGAMARVIHNARVNECVVLDLYSFSTLIRGCGQVIWSVHGRCSMVMRESIGQEYREVVERRVFTVTGNRLDEEILDTVVEIQERHDAVRDLERKLLELQKIFLDMAVLVEAQGDMISHIETHGSVSTQQVKTQFVMPPPPVVTTRSLHLVYPEPLIVVAVLSISACHDIVAGLLQPCQQQSQA